MVDEALFLSRLKHWNPDPGYQPTSADLKLALAYSEPTDDALSPISLNYDLARKLYIQTGDTNLIAERDRYINLINQVNVALVPINVLINQYHQTINVEQKLVKLNEIFYAHKKLDSQYNPKKIGKCAVYLKSMHAEFFQGLKREFSTLGSSIPCNISKQTQAGLSLRSVDKCSEMLANMDHAYLSRLIQILSIGEYFNENELQTLYDINDPEYPEYMRFLQDHQIEFLGGRNAQNFKITSLLDASVSVLKIGSAMDNPVYPAFMLAQDVLTSGELAHVSVQRPGTYIDKAKELVTRTLSITEFCEEGNFEDYPKACGLAWMTQTPTTENLKHLSRSHYIRTANDLFYYNKRDDSIQKITFKKNHLTFDKNFTPNTSIARLSNTQLELIKKMTGHSQHPGKGSIESALGLITQMGVILEKARQAGVGFPDQKGLNWMVNGGCNLHIVSSSQQLKAVNCYSWDGKELVYIPAHGVRKTVKIDNMEVFEATLEKIRTNKSETTLHLTSLDIGNLITANGGHIPDGTIQIADTKSFIPLTPDGNVDQIQAKMDGYSLIRSREMWPPEFSQAKPFSADKMNSRMLVQNLYKYTSGCSWAYLQKRDENLDSGENYDFSNPLFATETGKQIKSLIQKSIKPKSEDRNSVAEVLLELKYIAMTGIEATQEKLAQACVGGDVNSVIILLRKGALPTQLMLSTAETTGETGVVDVLKPKLKSMQAIFNEMDDMVADFLVVSNELEAAAKKNPDKYKDISHKAMVLSGTLYKSMERAKSATDLTDLICELNVSLVELNMFADEDIIADNRNTSTLQSISNLIAFIPEKMGKILSGSNERTVRQVETIKKIDSLKERLMEMKRTVEPKDEVHKNKFSP